MPAGSGNGVHTRRITLAVPAEFRFLRVVQSHGWFDLPPFDWDPKAERLSRALRLPGAGAALAQVSAVAGDRGPQLAVRLTASRAITPSDARDAGRQVARMLRLDEDLGEFYRLAGSIGRPDLRWMAVAGAGRLLRCPTVFEDLVKMICTTNCTWALTSVMVRALVGRLGEEAPGGARLFPLPAAMAARPGRFYRDVLRAGYRGVSLRRLARQVARGEIDLESWSDPARSTTDIREEVLSVHGAGRYVADNMLKLLGRYDGLGIDTWCRRKFSSMHARGRPVTDRRIERFYEPFGRWRGLALWCDITRDWFDEDGRSRVAPSDELPAATY